jgi:hypothetical protein
MSARKAALLIVPFALALGGCEACNGGITHSSRNISDQIIRAAEGICGASADSPHGGVKNIMLMESREDDGIVTCGDGTNTYFDA